MINDAQGHSPPHWLLLPLVIGIVLVVPLLLGDGGEAVTEAISESLSPVGLLFLPVVLILAIQFLSSNRAASIASAVFNVGGGGGAGFQRDGGGGSPIGVVLILLLVLGLLYSKMSIFGGDGDE